MYIDKHLVPKDVADYIEKEVLPFADAHARGENQCKCIKGGRMRMASRVHRWIHEQGENVDGETQQEYLCHVEVGLSTEDAAAMTRCWEKRHPEDVVPVVGTVLDIGFVRRTES